MIKIKISYSYEEEKSKIIKALSTLKILKVSKPYKQKNHSSVYVEVE